MSISKMLLATVFGLVPAVGCAAQNIGAPTTPARPHFIAVNYPAERDRAIAVVGGKPVTLGQLIDHIDERHHPGFAEALGRTGAEKRHELHRMLHSDLMAPWTRHFADIKAFEFVTKDTNIDRDKLEAAISARLKTEFEAWLAKYVAGRPANAGPLSQQAINRLLARYQMESGLAIEVQGWLDYFEPGNYNRKQLRDFFNANARFFGGMVTISHILVQHRDAGNGILLGPEGTGKASARLAVIRGSLKEDGSNFEQVAAFRSEDTRTAKDGGKLTGIRRFDDRLPATICRAAWSLQDGEVSDIVESQYGWHLIKRLEFNQNMFVLFTDKAIPSIKIVMRRAMQEQALFAARAQAKVELKL